MSGDVGSNCPSDCLELEESRGEEERCSSGPGPAMSSLQDATETSSHQNRMGWGENGSGIRGGADAVFWGVTKAV